MLDVFDKKKLKKAFAEIDGPENRARKLKAFKELDIYSGNQDIYINKKISKMYGADACNHIQTITGIELSSRIVNAEASPLRGSPFRVGATHVSALCAA